MKKILVAVDGSQHSAKTLDKASCLARKNNSQLIILYTCTDELPARDQLEFASARFGRDFCEKVSGNRIAPYSVSQLDSKQAISEFMAARKQLCESWGGEVLNKARNRALDAGVSRIKTCKKKGNAVDSIIETARTEAANLIVIGRRKPRGLLDRVFPTTSDQVARKAPCEAVVVE